MKRLPRRRGPGVSKLRIDCATPTVRAPEGSRRKGCEDSVVRDIRFAPLTTLYRRERWPAPDGRMIVAELPSGGPHPHRLVVILRFQGRITQPGQIPGRAFA
jgi:hypothetical protein